MIRFLVATGGWTAAVLGSWILTIAIANGGRNLGGDEILQILTMSVAFSSFAGGISAVRPGDGIPWSRYRAALVTACLVGAAVWWTMAYGVPLVEFRSQPVEVDEVRIPDAPRTPGMLKELRATAIATPPVDPLPRIDSPDTWAESWINYTLIRPRVVGLLAPLSAVLGMMAAILTLGLRPGRRRRLRWALGLGAVGVYYVSDAFVSSSLVTDPAGSGVVRSWAVLVPMLCLATAGWGMIWARTRGR